MERTDKSPPRFLIGVLSACYVGVQVILPLVLLLCPGGHPSDFSWDMFSHRLRCTRIEARASVPGGRSGHVALEEDFRSFAQLSRVLFPRRLEAYARYICEQLRIGERQPVEVRFTIECADGRTQAPRLLFDETRDYCAGASAAEP